MATELSLISENRPPSASVGGPMTSARTPPQSISIPVRKTSVLTPSSRTPRKNVLYVRVLFGSPETKTVSTGKASNTSRKPPMWSASGLLTIVPAYGSRKVRPFTCPECGNRQEVEVRYLYKGPTQEPT